MVTLSELVACGVSEDRIEHARKENA